MQRFLMALLVLCVACGDDDGSVDPDAGPDAGTDTGPMDAGTDAGSDAGDDAGTDAGSDAGSDAGMAFTRVRGWHLSGTEEAETIDVYADDTAVTTATAYEALSDWMDIDPGSYAFTIRRGGTDFDYQDFGTIDIAVGDQYTFISAQLSAPGGTSPWIPIAVAEDTDPPPAGMAKVLLFHGSYAFEGGVALHDMADPDTALVTIAAQGEVAASSVMLPAGTYTFGVDVGAGADTFGDPDGVVDYTADMTIELTDQQILTLGAYSRPGIDGDDHQLVFPSAAAGPHTAVGLTPPG